MQFCITGSEEDQFGLLWLRQHVIDAFLMTDHSLQIPSPSLANPLRLTGTEILATITTECCNLETISGVLKEFRL